MAGPSFRPGEYKKLPKWQKTVYWTGVTVVVLAIVFLVLKRLW